MEVGGRVKGSDRVEDECLVQVQVGGSRKLFPSNNCSGITRTSVFRTVSPFRKKKSGTDVQTRKGQ